MGKKMCKLYKDLDDPVARKEYMKLVAKSKFLCTKCGRTAKSKELLCKPVKINKVKSAK